MADRSVDWDDLDAAVAATIEEADRYDMKFKHGVIEGAKQVRDRLDPEKGIGVEVSDDAE